MSALSGDAQRVAFYALRPGGLRDCITLLHPPYTAWHLSYVALGAGLAEHTDGARLAWTLAAFLLAVGVAAHCLDELNGRPLGTRLPASALVAAAAVSLTGAAAIGLWGMRSIGISLLPFVLIGVVLVIAYNLELFGGALHSDEVFALGWGAFPVLVGGFAQTGRSSCRCCWELPSRPRRASLSAGSRTGRGACAAAACASRALSSGAGEERQVLDIAVLTSPAEMALRALAAAHVLLAAALVALRLS